MKLELLGKVKVMAMVTSDHHALVVRFAKQQNILGLVARNL